MRRNSRSPPSVAEGLGVQHGARVRVSEGERTIEAELAIDTALPPGCIRVQAGTTLSAQLGPAFGAVELEKA